MLKLMPLVAVVLAAGCSYKAQPVAISAVNVYQSHDEKIPANVALYIEADALKKIVNPSTHQCSAHQFPLDARDAFKTGTFAAMKQIFSGVQLVQRPLSRTALKQGGYDAMVRVKAETMQVRLKFFSKLFSVEADASAELSASATVDGAKGRLHGGSASATKSAEGGAGTACKGGANVLAEAVRKSLRDLLGRIAERISSSRRVRQALRKR